METNFSVKQIADIAKKVRTYKKLTVTTRGQMFLKKVDAEEAVRTLNMIIDDTNDHVGILEVTEDMLSIENLRLYGKNPKLFGALFLNAKIPVSKTSKKEHKRATEKPANDSKKNVNDVEDALGLGKPYVTEAEQAKIDAAKVDPPKVDPPKVNPPKVNPKSADKK